MPNTVKYLIFVHRIKIGYAFEVFTILAGIVLQYPDAQKFGWMALGLTIGTNMAVFGRRPGARPTQRSAF